MSWKEICLVMAWCWWACAFFHCLFVVIQLSAVIDKLRAQLASEQSHHDDKTKQLETALKVRSRTVFEVLMAFGVEGGSGRKSKAITLQLADALKTVCMFLVSLVSFWNISLFRILPQRQFACMFCSPFCVDCSLSHAIGCH